MVSAAASELLCEWDVVLWGTLGLFKYIQYKYMVAIAAHVTRATLS